ncbi:irregular chiasm C-roughest protein isoform X1 [Bicyclus anynana]|uniref:Irregular chiasm C-roughest protein isoform X1 n=1 Tax=Bicyclus anynana TaxID=110368 RepID=A0ABM3LVP6_BICAN|nr:irregular chiasm C-roughest protein isoform X1 [Bicyclus anynana]XP_052743115.1 irregular chiasm C-roughest protein isoform X1 [Bicyclus anynana]XP_052743116.1 irregular chiasm C-roughest protein isoform X1 [Bicyclus anynana]
MSNCYRMRLTSRCVTPLFLLLRTRLVCVFVLCCVNVCGGYVEQKFAMEPQDQTAVVGSRVTLPCRVENKAGQLQWTKDDFGLGLHRELSGYDRYKMIGSDEEGDYSLDIREVTLDDDAKYQCQVSSGVRGEPAIRSRYARLTVLVPPEPPKILQGNFYSTTEDRIIKLECVSVGGKPPAEITWVDSNAGVLTQGVTNTVEPLSDGQRFTARSIIRMSPKQEHNNQTFTCQAQNTADRAYRAASIQIEVKYAPKVKIRIKSGRRIPEGQDVVISCTADANPSNLTFRWVMNESIIGNSSELKIANISRAYNGAVLKCMVFNDVGKSEETEALEITYPPSLRTLPKDVEAEVGKQVTLTCDVDGFPAPEIRWLHYEEDTNIRVGRTANLTLTVDTHTSGRYLCKASVEGYPEIEAEASIFIKGPPKIISNHTQFGSQGDTVNIECAAFSVPRIDTIVWTYEDKEIDTVHDHDYLFREDIQPGGVVNSTLTIRESQSKHFGTYKCNVSNDYGSDTLEITLRPTKSFPLLLILFGVTSGTIMVAAVIMLVILCQRKQRKNKQAQVTEKPDVTVTAEELFKENDRNSNISDLKLELRQANGSCEIDYSNTGSDSTLCSNAKLGSGIPLAGSVPLSAINQTSTYQPYRYSNDYTDPAYVDCYKVNGFGNGYQTYVHYGHDYTPGSLRVQSPTLGSEKLTPNRSINGSLPRSVDTPSSVQYNASNGSQSNSLQRSTKRQDSSTALNTLSNEGARVPNGGIIQGVDVRYAATYGNPHLRTGLSTVHTAKPASTPAPPPYSSVRNSVILPSGTSSHSITSPTSLASPQCATSPITNSTMSTDSAQPNQVVTSSGTPQSPSAHYILAPSNRSLTTATVTKKGNSLQQPLATHV